MLYFIFESLYKVNSFTKTLRIFESITIRSVIAFVIAFLIVYLVGKPFIKFLKTKQFVEEIRKDGPESHYKKSGTPTMGGVLIIVALVIAVLITANLKNKYIIMLLLSSIAFSLIGFLDDFLKWKGKSIKKTIEENSKEAVDENIKLKKKKTRRGLYGKEKIFLQFLITLCIWTFLYYFPIANDEKLTFSMVNPVIKNHLYYLPPIIYLVFIMVLLLGTSNAVNLTDGLDGLVIGPVIVVLTVFVILAYVTGRTKEAEYLNMFFIYGASEILVFIAATIGACLGFLWYNSNPAEIFMGDTGSLTLGGIIGTISIFLKQEWLLPIIGFVFVVEGLSVILQTASFRLRGGKRIFKMAPIHHHFEKNNIPEQKITIRFWIIALICGIIGLLILKLR